MAKPENERDRIARIIQEHVKVDATGLAPAIVGHYVFGFGEAADAVMALRDQAEDPWNMFNSGFEKGLAQAENPQALTDALARVAELEQGLRDMKGAANSFCDCDGDVVAGQMTLRIDVLLSGSTPKPARVEGWAPTHRHVKSGGLYQVVSDGYDAANHHGEEAPRVVIYRNDTGVWWTRPTDEFHDGRFEDLIAALLNGNPNV